MLRISLNHLKFVGMGESEVLAIATTIFWNQFENAVFNIRFGIATTVSCNQFESAITLFIAISPYYADLFK